MNAEDQREWELGVARAEVNRLCARLARIKHVSFDFVLAQLIQSKTWKLIGDPDPKSLDLDQAQALHRVLTRWIEQAQAHQRPSHKPSKAPVPSWKRRAAPNPIPEVGES